MTTLSADLDIIITDNKINVVPGIGDTYNIVVTNFGPDTVSGVSLSVPLPSNAINATWTAVSANASGTPAHASGSGSIAETVDDLLAGGSVTYFLSLEADPSAIGHLTITATTSTPGGVVDPNPGNNSSTDNDTLTPQADLAVTMTDGAATVVPGTSTTYTITITNNGPSTVSSLTLTDSIPAALLNATFGTPSAGSYDSATGVWSGLSLASGDAVTLTLTGTIDPNAIGPITNTVTVAPPTGTTDLNSANDTASDTDTTPADLAVFMTGAPAVPGASITSTITVSNNGPSTVSSLTLTHASSTALLNPAFGTPSAGSYNATTGVWSGAEPGERPECEHHAHRHD